MDPDIVDVLLQRFEAATQAGYVTVGGVTLSILWTLAGITMVVAIVWNMWGGKTPWGDLFSKVILIWFFAWVVEGWPEITQQIQQTFISVGLMAGDASMTAADFLTPSAIKIQGDEASGLFFKAADEVTFSFSFSSGFGGSIAEWLGFYLAGWAVRLAYWLVSIMIFMSQVIFYISSVIALFMVAWMVFSATSWIGRGALGWLVSSGTMLMALAAIVSIMMTVFRDIAFDTIDEYAANQALLGSIVMMALVVASGTIARGIGNGVASWGMGAAISTAGAAAMAAGAAASAAKMIGGGARQAAMGQMSRAGANGAIGSGGGISMRSPTSYMGGGAGGRAGTNVGGGASRAGQGAVSNRGMNQLNRGAAQRPTAVSSIMVARAATPEIADEGPGMQADHMGR